MMLAQLFRGLNMEWNGGGEMEERMSIRDSSKALKKYGSTAKHMTRNENLVKHVVSASDTLQGIALKYGVTTEQIRRANRLWASDSLFLREYLLIPVPGDINASLGNYSILPSGAESSQGIESITSPSSITSSIDDESSVDDFLAKMDSSIASMKKEVKRAQGNSEFCHEGDDTFTQRRRAVARLRNSHPISSTTNSSAEPSELLRTSSSGDVHNLPSAVVMTQGRRVKTSLQRLQQQQDEMFQL
ncbi:lysM and putative peptidoglycan-binding domain-containing protein 2 isoform X2 [Neodiprion pinetum]|uniref:LysM and putative peptidoglycan-binding domain-containing protein 2 isoform X1 n=1 Tax=Neodiprion lecontei TaxID=441921 RepID=A0A6J0BXM5_NEOLC|nr:lysM and putative peptidoglycan-binding domain-containing protein 2 isoform X1 [Neodiprion lecontei]XP_046423745.1 lysM and putative peptidoglycan-binding domain-containing protein 2 isoform X1 [Neodiprion fabricii]XP_046617414.1 lysM and putative peptidoglycan-binding domain-containing protein 2 isoform X1 [Neodiprion virginianus]